MKCKSVLECIYSKVEEENRATFKYRKLQNELFNISEKLYKHINEDDKQEVEKIIDVLYDMATEENKQFFKEGFTLATNLLTEIYYKSR